MVPNHLSAIELELKDFGDSIQNRRAPLVSGKDARLFAGNKLRFPKETSAT